MYCFALTSLPHESVLSVLGYIDSPAASVAARTARSFSAHYEVGVDDVRVIPLNCTSSLLLSGGRRCTGR